MIPKLPKFYWLLAIARILLVLIPQFGYIHPDEFFQSIEVQAGNAFEVEHNQPWEFNVTFPIRSVTISYFTIGLVYRLGKTFHAFFPDIFTVTPYFLVVGPRLLMCLMSFFVDFSIFKICSNNNEKYRNKLVVLASSFVILVFATRTFSNSVELILFALLQYYVCESLSFSNTLIKKRDYLNYRYETSRSMIEKVKFHKLRLFLQNDSLHNCLQISTITVFGFFNRPTFLAFAIFPIFFWLYRGIGNKFVKPLNYHLRILVLILCSVPSLLFNILVDSLYYGFLTWGEVGVLDITINNFIFTPLNFIKYNLNSDNLAQHGIHPRFLHIIVNMPLLFNILALFTYNGFLQSAYNFVAGRHQLLPSVRSIKAVMMTSYLAPLLLLSIFPHQEPRFLIPLIVPLVYLHSSDILPEEETSIIKSEHTVVVKTTKPKSNVYFKLWLTINLILITFFGFLHQGGVYQVANHLSKEMTVDYRSDFYIVTSNIYTIPQSLFLQKTDKFVRYSRNTKYVLPKRYFLYEKGSKDLALLIGDLKKIAFAVGEKKHKFYLVIPSSLQDELVDSRVVFKKVRTFYPHISTEAFPKLAPPQDLLYYYSNFSFDNFLFDIGKFGSSFGLNLYQVVMNK